MSRFSYIGSYLKSFSVQSAVTSDIYKPDRTLCVARGQTLEFYKLVQDHLELCKEKEFFSYIHALEVLKTPSSDTILVLIHQHYLFQLQNQDNELKMNQISLKIVSNPINAKNFFMKINTQASLLCVHDYQNYFRVFKIREGKVIEDGNLLINNQGGLVRDIEFVNFGKTLLILSLGDNNKDSLLHFYNTEDVSSSPKPFKFEDYPGKLLRLPSDELILLLTSNSYKLLDLSIHRESVQESEEFGKITAKCLVDPTRWIISNLQGKYFIITFGPSIEIKRIGVQIAAAGIVYLDSGLFFLAGFENLSRVVKVDCGDAGFSLSETSKFPGICCVNDLKLMEDDEIGEFNFLVAAGVGLNGGMTKSYKAVMVNVISELEIENVDGLWELRIGSAWDNYFAISILGSTKILRCQDSELFPITFPEFQSSEGSFILFQYLTSLIQVTKSGIFTYGVSFNKTFSKQTSEFTSSSILLASGHSNTLVLAMHDCSVICFEITKNSILQIWQKKFEKEISAVQCNENFVAICFWESNSVEIYEKYSGNRKFDTFGQLPATANSLKFVCFNETVFLFIGLRNGSLFYMNLENLEVKKLNLGAHGVVVEEIWFKGKNFVFAAGDSSVIVYFFRGKVTHVSFGIRKVRVLCGFHTEAIRDCMLVAQKDKMVVINYEEIAKHSYEDYSLQLTIIQIEILRDFYLAVCQDISKTFILKTFSFDFEQIASTFLQPNEYFVSFSILENILFIACTVINPIGPVDESGILKLYSFPQGRLTLINELPTQHPISSLKPFKSFLIFGSESLSIYQLESSTLQLLDCIKSRGIVCSIDTCEELIATVSLREYLTIYTLNQNKLMSLYKYNQMDSGANVKFINRKLLCVGDKNCNVCVFELSGTFVNLVCGFNFENKAVNKILSLQVSEQIYGFAAPCVALSTRTGNIFMIIWIKEEDFVVLSALQGFLVKQFKDFYKFLEGVWQVSRRNKVKDVNCCVNGDFLAKFESLEVKEQRNLAQKVTKKIGRVVTEESLNALIYSLSRIH